MHNDGHGDDDASCNGIVSSTIDFDLFSNAANRFFALPGFIIIIIRKQAFVGKPVCCLEAKRKREKRREKREKER